MSSSFTILSTSSKNLSSLLSKKKATSTDVEDLERDNRFKVFEVPKIEKSISRQIGVIEESLGRERPVINAWTRPLKYKRVETYDPNSIAAFVVSIREKIEFKGKSSINLLCSTSDQKDFEKFQNKFKKLEEEWRILMDKILKIVVDLDKMYLNTRYYGYLDQIKQDFSNIALSFIVIGPDIYDGSGIDNLNEEPLPTNKTINTMIEEYLDALPLTMLKLKFNQERILDLDNDHLNLFQERTEIESVVNMYRSNLKKTENKMERKRSMINELNKKLVTKNDKVTRLYESLSNIRSDKNHTVEQIENVENELDAVSKEIADIEWQLENLPSEIELLKCQLDVDVINLREKESELAKCKKKFNIVVNEKNYHKQEMQREYIEIYNLLFFNYFFHEDWFPALDHRLSSLRN